MSEPSKLSKRLERTRQKIELLQAQRQLRMLESFERGQRLPVRLPKAQQNLQESSSEAWQWVSGYQDVIDRFNGTDRDFIFPFSTAMDRRYGENWPFWRTWQEHARLRAASRLIWTLSPLASGAISALTSYVVGEGMQTKIAGKDKDVAKELVAAVQAVVDSIIDRNDWMTMQQECFTRARRDGEFFLRDFPQDDGMTLFRIVDPEQIMEPPGMSREEASFGIITDPDDLLDIRGYWWAPRGVPSLGEYLPSSDVLHVKENVDGIIKRGLPDFAFDTQQLYKTVNRLLINMGQGASIQSAIAFVRQHKNVDTASIEAFVNAQGDYSETRPFTGVQQTIQRLEGGSVIDMDANQDFVKSPGADNVSGFTQVVQALLRAVATRWNAPEWIVSADASNNNMASSMVAESPFVKTCKRFQHRYARAFKHVIVHALRHYCRVRGGLRVGMSKYTWATLSQLIDVQVVPPTVETRNRQEEAMVNRTYVELGVKSRKTIATELGLDWDTEQQNNDEYDKAHPQGGQGGAGGNPLAAMMGGGGDQPPDASPPDEPQPPDDGGDDNTNQPPQDDNEDFSDLEGFLDSIDLNESRRSTLNQFADTEIHSAMHTQILFDPAKTIFSEGEWVNSVLNQPAVTPLIESRQTSSLTELEAFASQLPVDERLSYIRQALLEGRGIDKLGRVICWNDKGKRIPCNQEKSETSHKDRQRANEGLQKLMAAPHAVTPKDAESVAKALKHLAHDELAALKKQHGLRASGKKEELINRLVGAASKILTQRQQYERQARAEGVPPAYVNSIAQQNYKIGAGYVREARKLIWAARDYYEGMTGKKLRIMRANGRMDPSSIPELELIARGLKTQYPGFLNPDEMADDTENARVLFDLLVTGGPAMPDRGEMYKQAIEQAKHEAKKAEDEVPFDMEGLGDETPDGQKNTPTNQEPIDSEHVSQLSGERSAGDVLPSQRQEVDSADPGIAKGLEGDVSMRVSGESASNDTVSGQPRKLEDWEKTKTQWESENKFPQVIWDQIRSRATHVSKDGRSYVVTMPVPGNPDLTRIAQWDNRGPIGHIDVPVDNVNDWIRKNAYVRGDKLVRVTSGMGGTLPSPSYAGAGFQVDSKGAKGVKRFVGPADKLDWMLGRLESGGYTAEVEDIPEPPAETGVKMTQGESKIPDHWYRVSAAMAEGKPVPNEVLKDYPDILNKFEGKHLFTGTDSLGREWVNGKLKPKEEPVNDTATAGHPDADGESAPVTPQQAESRKWTKNPDGTYTSPGGTVWRKAKEGGEHSPVNGKFFQGGWLMPIHGKSVKREEAEGKGESDGGSEVGIGGQKEKKKTGKTKTKKPFVRRTRDKDNNLVEVPEGFVPLENLVSGSPSSLHTGRFGDQTLAYLGLTRKQVSDIQDIYQETPYIPKEIVPPSSFSSMHTPSDDWNIKDKWNEWKSTHTSISTSSSPSPRSEGNTDTLATPVGSGGLSREDAPGADRGSGEGANKRGGGGAKGEVEINAPEKYAGQIPSNNSGASQDDATQQVSDGINARNLSGEGTSSPGESKEFYHFADAAKQLGISPDEVKSLFDKGELKGFRVPGMSDDEEGGGPRIQAKSVEAYKARKGGISSPDVPQPPSPGFSGKDDSGHCWDAGVMVPCPDDDKPETTTEVIPDESATGDQPVSDAEESSAEAKSTPSVQINTIADHQALMAKMRDGIATASELQSGFESLLANEKTIKAELSKRSLKELAPRGTGGRKKGEIVDSIFNSMMDRYTAGEGYSVTDFNNFHDAKINAIRKVLSSLTDQKIKDYSTEILQAKAERDKALSNPETYEEFSRFVSVKGEDALAPEQREKWDDLIAEKRRQMRQADLTRKAVITKANIGDNVKMTLHQGWHDKHQREQWVVSLDQKVERSQYDDLLSKAKQLGGYYSSFRGGKAIPGFQFANKEDAEKFMALQSGNVDASDKILSRQEEKKLAASERLGDAADRLQSRATEELNRDRLANTARRAGMAESAQAQARKDLAFSETLRNISSAIESGEAKHLQGLATLAQAKLLDRLVNQSHFNAVRAKHKGSDDRKAYEADMSRDANTQDMASAEYPYPRIHRDIVRGMASKFAVMPGMKQVASRLQKQLAALKENDWQVTFQNRQEIEDFEAMVRNAEKIGEGRHGAMQLKDVLDDYNRMKAMGIESLPELRAALREFVRYRGKAGKEDPVKAMERKLIGKPIPGFFPTPVGLIDRMVDAADIQPGMRVLEPSAGKGDILDVIKSQQPDVEMDAIEPVGELREILQAKGYPVVGSDVMQHAGEYDRVIMNPPFENGQDIDHVRKAFDMLKPGGKLVAIMSAGPFFRADAKAKQFREWLQTNSGISEELDNAFAGRDAFRQTGVNTRMVVIEKDPMFSGKDASGKCWKDGKVIPCPDESSSATLPTGTASEPSSTELTKSEIIRNNQNNIDNSSAGDTISGSEEVKTQPPEEPKMSQANFQPIPHTKGQKGVLVIRGDTKAIKSELSAAKWKWQPDRKVWQLDMPTPYADKIREGGDVAKEWIKNLNGFKKGVLITLDGYVVFKSKEYTGEIAGIYPGNNGKDPTNTPRVDVEAILRPLGLKAIGSPQEFTKSLTGKDQGLSHIGREFSVDGKKYVTVEAGQPYHISGDAAESSGQKPGWKQKHLSVEIQEFSPEKQRADKIAELEQKIKMYEFPSDDDRGEPQRLETLKQLKKELASQNSNSSSSSPVETSRVETQPGEKKMNKILTPITYTPQSGPLAGITFTGGDEKTHPQHGRGVMFTLPDEAKKRLKTKDTKAFLRVASNPGLAEEIDRYNKDVAGMKAAEEKAKADEIAGLRSGEIKIKPYYHNGDILSGYSVDGEEAKILRELGLVKDITGWGTLVDQKVIDALGKEFTIQQAEAYARPKLDAAKKAKEEKSAAFQAKVAELAKLAKETGKPQQLDTRNEVDYRPDVESDITIVTRWVHPDGSITTTQAYAH